MTALYVASHYRNTPNDLQLAADAPAHVLFVLLGPVDESANVMPDVLAAVQVGCFPENSLLGAGCRGLAVSGAQCIQHDRAVGPSFYGWACPGKFLGKFRRI